MLSLAILTLVALVASPFLGLPEASARSSQGASSPAHWLANLRNATGATAPLANGPGVRSIRFSGGATPVMITEAEKYELEKTRLRYFDVTEDDMDSTKAEHFGSDGASLGAFPSGPTHQDEVNAVIATLSIENLKADLETLTAYNNRYYKAPTGAQAAIDLVKKLRAIASTAPGTGGAISVNTFAHSFPMPSVIGRIEGTNSSAPMVIIGAHLDSINADDPMSGPAPGADDDASGTVNLIESFRKLIAAGFKPANPVEFHWYAGEEAGLLGSRAISNAYAKKGTRVRGMLQLDMTAYVKPGTSPVVGFITDYVSAALTTYTKTLVETYLTGVGIVESECGYACSDHAAWTSAGYPSVLPLESPFHDANSRKESAYDSVTVEGFDWDHCHEFTKLAVAFLMELSLPAPSIPPVPTPTDPISTSTTSDVQQMP